VQQAGRPESWIAELGIVSHGTSKNLDEQLSDSDILQLEFRKLVGQCSILVVIAGIVSWLVAT
jgi:hypothetical protein